MNFKSICHLRIFLPAKSILLFRSALFYSSLFVYRLFESLACRESGILACGYSDSLACLGISACSFGSFLNFKCAETGKLNLFACFKCFCDSGYNCAYGSLSLFLLKLCLCGNNINQLARKANAGFASRDEVTRALRMLDRVYELMYQLSQQSWQ